MSIRHVALSLVALTGVLTLSASAQSSEKGEVKAAAVNPTSYVALGVSGASGGLPATAWYLDTATQRVVVCLKNSAAPPRCEAVPMPK